MLVTTLAISLYSYLYLKLAKCCFFHNSYVFFSTKSVNQRAEQVLHGSGGGEKGGGKGENGGGKVVKIIYALISKCKNDKNKIYLKNWNFFD
jgi:hypothetical protein